MDHSLHTPLDATKINESNLIGAVIYGPEDEKIGTVAHVHGMGHGMQVIVDVGGFLGIGAKPVSLDASRLRFMRDEDGAVHAVTTWTKDQVKDMPEHQHCCLPKIAGRFFRSRPAPRCVDSRSWPCPRPGWSQLRKVGHG